MEASIINRGAIKYIGNIILIPALISDDHSEEPLLDNVNLDERHRKQSDHFYSTGADLVRFIGTADQVGVEVIYTFSPHYNNEQLDELRELLGDEILTLESEYENGIYTVSYGYKKEVTT